MARRFARGGRIRTLFTSLGRHLTPTDSNSHNRLSQRHRRHQHQMRPTERLWSCREYGARVYIEKLREFMSVRSRLLEADVISHVALNDREEDFYLFSYSGEYCPGVL